MKTSKTLSLVLSLAMCLLAMSSCKREGVPGGKSNGKIKTIVSSTDPETKAANISKAELTQAIVLDEEKGIILQEHVSDNLSQPFGDAEISTKGTVVTTGNIATVYGLFGMEGFIDNYQEVTTDPNLKPTLYDEDQYIKGGKVEYNKKDGSWDLTDGTSAYNWLSNTHFTFWSYAPMEHSGAYSYLSKGERKTMSITDFVNPTDASEQKDLLVAYNNRWYDDKDQSETVKINFRHALADIYFNVKAITDDGYTVESIVLSGAYSKGSCEVTGSLLSDDDVTAAFDWTPDTESGTTFQMSGESDVAGETDHFFMIPQDRSTEEDGVTFKITIMKEGHKIELNTKLSTKWLAGKYYLYTLKYNGLDIEIDDTVSGDVKSNLEISNVGNKPAYVRTLVTGYWVNTEGDIVAAWDPSDETMGVFSPKIFATTPILNENWVKGVDGFFYYTKILPADQETITSLFDSYVVNESGKPKNLKLSDHLEIDIVSQAVVVDEGKAAITTAWGATAAGYMTE